MSERLKKVVVPKSKKIVLIAHDNKKPELLDWAKMHKRDLKNHSLYATGTTGKLIENEIGLKVVCFESGPLGGDMQAGAFITDGKLDLILFFWDPLAAQPHDPDVRALLRVAVVWNIPLACNRASADFIVTSPLFNEEFTKSISDFSSYKSRKFLKNFKEK